MRKGSGCVGSWRDVKGGGDRRMPEPGGRCSGVVRKRKRGYGKEWAGNF